MYTESSKYKCQSFRIEQKIYQLCILYSIKQTFFEKYQKVLKRNVFLIQLCEN